MPSARSEQFNSSSLPPTMTLLSAISSMSLGRAWQHSLSRKLDMAAKYQLRGIELFFEDLEYHAVSSSGVSSPPTRLQAAHDIAQLCAARDIAVISMQPFYHYEGLKDRVKHDRRIQDAKEWFTLAKALGTDLILVPSNFLRREDLFDELSLHIQDLIEIADLGLSLTPPIRFCYESLAWGTHVSTWEHCWEIVSAVNRPNFGICLDAFNIAARVWADPTIPGGRAEGGDAALHASCQRLMACVDPAKLFLVQIADAEQLSEPLCEGHRFYEVSQPARMSWSRNCRLFYGEEGGYLPVAEIARGIIKGLNYRGWVSAELFNRRMADADEIVPEELASRASRAWVRFERDMEKGLNSARVTSAKQPGEHELLIKVDEVIDAKYL